MTPSEKKIKLYDLCLKFINENDIYCDETVYQSDRVIQEAYDFIAEICEIVGYKEFEDDGE